MIEVNEYVRTKDGIIDKAIIEYNGKCNNSNCSEKHISCKYNYYNEKDVVKHSKQLIDLIEVGDYVNGYKVRGKTEKKIVVDYCCYSKELGEKNWLTFYNDMIQEILTKESYMANCYKVGGEDEQRNKV